MIRITCMRSGLYGFKIKDIEDELENIREFLSNGEPVILVNDLDDMDVLEKYGIDADSVKMV